MSQCHKQNWRGLFFTCMKILGRVLACARPIAHIKWRRLVPLQVNQFLEGPTAPSPPLIREGGGSNYDKLMQAVAVFILATLILLS